MLTIILGVLAEVLKLANTAIADWSDAPPKLVDYLAKAASELDELRADMAGRQDAEDRAEVDAP